MPCSCAGQLCPLAVLSASSGPLSLSRTGRAVATWRAHLSVLRMRRTSLCLLLAPHRAHRGSSSERWTCEEASGQTQVSEDSRTSGPRSAQHCCGPCACISLLCLFVVTHRALLQAEPEQGGIEVIDEPPPESELSPQDSTQDEESSSDSSAPPLAEPNASPADDTAGAPSPTPSLSTLLASLAARRGAATTGPTTAPLSSTLLAGLAAAGGRGGNVWIAQQPTTTGDSVLAAMQRRFAAPRESAAAAAAAEAAGAAPGGRIQSLIGGGGNGGGVGGLGSALQTRIVGGVNVPRGR